MFDDELAMLGESFTRLGHVRTGVTQRGGRADEPTLTAVLTATERLRRAADALELAVIGHAVRWGRSEGRTASSDRSTSRPDTSRSSPRKRSRW